MKLSLIKTASVLAVAVAAASVSAQPKFYGKANVSFNSNDFESDSEENYTLNSNASRLGVKGEYEISEDLSAVYKAEYEIFIDDGEKEEDQTFSQRNIYVGLKGDFGMVVAGKFDTPTKKAQGKVDRFNDLSNGDIKNVLQGENRVADTIMYVTPSLGGAKVSLAFVPGEESGEAGENQNDIADGVSASVSYKADAFRIALAHDNGEAIDGSVENLTRLVGEYKGDGFKLGALYQVADEGDNDEDSYVLSGEVKLSSKVVIKGQYASSDDESDEKTQIAIGADYKLAKKAKLYAYASQIEIDDGASTEDDQTVGFGMELKF